MRVLLLSIDRTPLVKFVAVEVRSASAGLDQSRKLERLALIPIRR